jgi:hypothetical protein
MKTNMIENSSERFIYIAISSMTLLISVASIITGAIYPVQTREQQMLKSWDLSGMGYICVLMIFLLGTLIPTAGLCYKLKMKPTAKERSVWDVILSISAMIAGTIFAFFLSYVILGKIIYGTWNLFHNSTVVPSVSLFIAFGFILGLNVGKIAKLWK